MAVHKLSKAFDYLGEISKQDALAYIYSGRAVMLAPTDEVWHSPSTSMVIPYAIQMLYGRAWATRMVLRPSAANIFRRDNQKCQYCGSGKDLTLDHVIPQAFWRSGRAQKDYPGLGMGAWENLVTACQSCNNKKGGRTPKEAGMVLATAPRRPTQHELSRVDEILARIWAAMEAAATG